MTTEAVEATQGKVKCRWHGVRDDSVGDKLMFVWIFDLYIDGGASINGLKFGVQAPAPGHKDHEYYNKRVRNYCAKYCVALDSPEYHGITCPMTREQWTRFRTLLGLVPSPDI